MSRKALIAESFARRACSYDNNSDIQERVAARLGEFLPDVERPRVLELGCGTGLFTRHLLERYPLGRFLISDISNDMVAACTKAVGSDDARTFEVIDADQMATSSRFDVIASSMVVHWCEDPTESLTSQLSLLNPGGRVVFATLGPDNFPQWQATLKEMGMESGSIVVPPLSGVVFEDRITVDYGSAKDFLATMKHTGAALAQPGYQPLSAPALNRVCAAYDKRFGGTVTWHIVYGVLTNSSRA